MIYQEEKNMSKACCNIEFERLWDLVFANSSKVSKTTLAGTGFSVGEALTLFSTFSTSTVVCDDDNNNGVWLVDFEARSSLVVLLYFHQLTPTSLAPKTTKYQI